MIDSTENELELPNSKDVLVLRTDFSNDQKWNKICQLISKSGREQGFQPYVEYQ